MFQNWGVVSRYHGQLWVPIAGTYSFKLYADTSARLFVGTENILNATGEFCVVCTCCCHPSDTLFEQKLQPAT